MPPNMCQEVYRGLRLNKGFKEPVPPRGCGRQGHRKFQKNMESDRKACRIPLAAWRSMPSPPGETASDSKGVRGQLSVPGGESGWTEAPFTSGEAPL